jgi:hypothetical protein
VVGVWGFNAGYHNFESFYNTDGYKDLSTAPGTAGSFSTITLYMEISGADMLSDQADRLYIYAQTTVTGLTVESCYFSGPEDTYHLTDLVSETYEDHIEITYNISQSQLDDIALFNCGGLFIDLDPETPITPGDTITTDLQISPEYYEETETENTTVYEPYIRTLSNPYNWTQWTLGIGGGILFLVALVASSWINPQKWIDKHRGRGRRR